MSFFFIFLNNFLKTILFICLFLSTFFFQKKSQAWSDWDDFDSPKWMKVDADSSRGKAIKRSGDFMEWVPLIMAVGMVAYHKDFNIHKVRFKDHFKEDFFSYERYKNNGFAQLVLSYGVSMGAYAILNATFQRPRPRDMLMEGKSHHWFGGRSGRSFPSGHTTNAYAPAFFIAWRYGWLKATPALLAAVWTGYTRIAVSAHYITDVVAGAGLSALISYFFTHPYKVGKTQVQVGASGDVGASVSIQW